MSDHVAPTLPVLAAVGAALVYCRVLVEARFNRTIALALLRDTRPDVVLTTLLHAVGYVVLAAMAGVAFGLWQRARSRDRYSEGAVALLLTSAAGAVALLPAIVLLPISLLAFPRVRRAVLDGEGPDNTSTKSGALVGGAVLFGGVVLLIASGMWLPLERITTAQGELVIGYVVRDTPSTMVLRDSDRLVVDIGPVSNRTPCRRPIRPPSVFQRTLPDFAGFGPKLPACTPT